MKRMILTLLLAVITLPAHARELGDVEAYFNSLSTFKAHFIQYTIGSTESYSGTFYLKKPGKFLWDFKDPVPHQLVSDGGRIFFKDGQNEQITQLPSSNPLYQFIGKGSISLPPEGFSTAYINQLDGTLEVSFIPEKEEDQNTLSRIDMVFTTPDIQLRKISSVDALGNETHVVFSDIQEGVELANHMFKMELPHYQEN